MSEVSGLGTAEDSQDILSLNDRILEYMVPSGPWACHLPSVHTGPPCQRGNHCSLFVLELVLGSPGDVPLVEDP